MERGKFIQHRGAIAALDSGGAAGVSRASEMAIRTLGWESVIVAADLTTITDITLTPYLYDATSEKFFALADVVLEELEAAEVWTYGLPVFFYAKAKTGSFGSALLYVSPGRASAKGA